jgi:uncharacterized membrane protein YidH (DUF202 family)
MNYYLLLAALSLLVMGIFAIAASSIGIECYNTKEHEEMKKEKKTNFDFLIVVLVSAILMVITAGISIYLAAQMPNY